jgi:hypothetical protein
MGDVPPPGKGHLMMGNFRKGLFSFSLKSLKSAHSKASNGNQLLNKDLTVQFNNKNVQKTEIKLKNDLF